VRFIPFSDERAREWDAVVCGSNDAWLFHLSDWVHLESERATSVSFLVELNGAVVAVCPLYRSRRRYAGVFPITCLHTGTGRAGPAIAAHVDDQERPAMLDEIFGHIEALANAHKAERLEIRLPMLAPNTLPPRRESADTLARYGLSDGVKYGRTLHQTSPVDRIVRLDQPVDGLYDQMDKDCRNAVRKAIKNDVVAVQSTSRRDIEDYHRLHVATYRRTGATPLPLRHF